MNYTNYDMSPEGIPRSAVMDSRIWYIVALIALIFMAIVCHQFIQNRHKRSATHATLLWYLFLAAGVGAIGYVILRGLGVF